MNSFNPDALVAWIFFASCGYLIAGSTGVAAGLAIITGIQMLLAVWGQATIREQHQQRKKN